MHATRTDAHWPALSLVAAVSHGGRLRNGLKSLFVAQRPIIAFKITPAVSSSSSCDEIIRS